MSITAIPVLARILSDRQLLRSKIGTLALACTPVDDITGWCILAYIVATIRAGYAGQTVWLTVTGSLAYVVLMVLCVKRMVVGFERSFRRTGYLTEDAIALLVLLVLTSSMPPRSSAFICFLAPSSSAQ